jgi:molybdate transport system substrate-binding protein
MRGVGRHSAVVLAVLLWTLALAGCGGTAGGRAAGEEAVRVAAAADLKFALDEIVALAEEQHPGLQVKVTYGSSGTFLQQLQNGAPFDLYLSADLDYPRQLVDDGLADEADLFRYAVGRLVLWVPEDSSVDPGGGLSVLTDERVRKVAIANPEHAPYGVAAVAAMRRAGVHDDVSPKLVMGENVAQAAEFVQSGNAHAGIVAKSLVLSDPLRDAGQWYELPLRSYPRLDQGGVVPAAAAAPTGARQLRDVLLSDAGVEVLATYGFSLPEE